MNCKSATEDDVKNGRAIFCIPKGSEPYDIGKPLPCVARLNRSIEDEGSVPVGTEIQIVQAETDLKAGAVLVGFYFGDKSEGVCTLEEVDLN